MNVKSPNNISTWQMGFNSAFKGLKWIFRKWDGGGMELIDLPEDRSMRWALVKAVMNLRVQ
jgi:hypothetical protein